MSHQVIKGDTTHMVVPSCAVRVVITMTNKKIKKRRLSINAHVVISLSNTDMHPNKPEEKVLLKEQTYSICSLI